jgi:hypothetical protein
MWGCHAGWGQDKGSETLSFNVPQRGNANPMGRSALAGGMGLRMRWWTRLKADENVSGGEGDHEDEGGGPPHPLHG